MVSGLLALASLAGALWVRNSCPPNSVIGYGIVAFWGLAPPIWFLYEWVCLCRYLDKDEQARIRHLHGLARNIWLALVTVLTAILQFDR